MGGGEKEEREKDWRGGEEHTERLGERPTDRHTWRPTADITIENKGRHKPRETDKEPETDRQTETQWDVKVERRTDRQRESGTGWAERLDDVLGQGVLEENRATCLTWFLVVLNPLATDT